MLLRENHSVASLVFFISFFLIHSFLRFFFTQVRDKCCDAWREVVTKMGDSSNQRYQKMIKKIKARYEECFKNQRLQNQILQHSNQHLQEQLEKLKDSLKVNRVMKVLQISFQNSFFSVVVNQASEESKVKEVKDLQKEITRLQFVRRCEEMGMAIVQQENERFVERTRAD